MDDEMVSANNFSPPKECILCRDAEGAGAAHCMGGGGAWGEGRRAGILTLDE